MRSRFPHAAGPLEDRDKILRAADRHHAIKIGELDRADASGQGGVQASFPWTLHLAALNLAQEITVSCGEALKFCLSRSQSNKESTR
jgi:hypothetical protein